MKVKFQFVFLLFVFLHFLCTQFVLPLTNGVLDNVSVLELEGVMGRLPANWHDCWSPVFASLIKPF